MPTMMQKIKMIQSMVLLLLTYMIRYAADRVGAMNQVAKNYILHKVEPGLQRLVLPLLPGLTMAKLTHFSQFNFSNNKAVAVRLSVIAIDLNCI